MVTVITVKLNLWSSYKKKKRLDVRCQTATFTYCSLLFFLFFSSGHLHLGFRIKGQRRACLLVFLTLHRIPSLSSALLRLTEEVVGVNLSAANVQGIVTSPLHPHCSPPRRAGGRKGNEYPAVLRTFPKVEKTVR